MRDEERGGPGTEEENDEPRAEIKGLLTKESKKEAKGMDK